MKTIIIISLFCLSAFARDPGTGSNTTTIGPGPATPASDSDTTAIHGGGTPSSSSEYSLDQDEPTAEELKQMQEKQESKDDKNYTDQNNDRDTM